MSNFTRLIGSLGFGKPAGKSSDVPAPPPTSEPIQEPNRPLAAVATPTTIAGTKNASVDDAAVTPAETARPRKTELGWWSPSQRHSSSPAR